MAFVSKDGLHQEITAETSKFEHLDKLKFESDLIIANRSASVDEPQIVNILLVNTDNSTESALIGNKLTIHYGYLGDLAEP